mgnify:FL=1
MSFMDSTMEFCYSCHHGPNTPRAYENLLQQAMEGNQRSFVREDEIEEAWRIIESVDPGQPFIYEPGQIPPRVEDFIYPKDWNLKKW